MKKLLITALIVGVATAVAIFYVATDSSTIYKKRTAGSMDDLEDAADNAFTEMNRHAGRVERKTEDIIDKAFA